MADIPDVTNWSLSIGGQMHPYGSSDTSGGTKRVAGQKDWTATVTALAQADDPIGVKGATGTLTLYTYSTSNYFAGTAMIESVDVNVDINTGAPIEYTYSFGGTGDVPHTGSGATAMSAKNANVDWT